MRLLALLGVTAACALPGHWPHTRDADWLVRVLQSAGFAHHGCTGSAFTVDLGRGQDLYVWAFTARRLRADPDMHVRVVAGVRVHVNRLRAAWRAGRRTVWIEAGPTTRGLPRPQRWRRVVAASLGR